MDIATYTELLEMALENRATFRRTIKIAILVGPVLFLASETLTCVIAWMNVFFSHNSGNFIRALQSPLVAFPYSIRFIFAGGIPAAFSAYLNFARWYMYKPKYEYNIETRQCYMANNLLALFVSSVIASVAIGLLPGAVRIIRETYLL